jgi:peptidoglycan/LPS O-acetylase OafA/YrhL
LAHQEHNNNFDALRIFAAILVLFDHQFPITRTQEPFFIMHRSFGELAVEIFFCVSGYLVAQSWQLDPHALRFAVKRVLRIWPGLTVMLVISVMVLGPMLSSLPPSDYFGDGSTWSYLFGNFLMRPDYVLPGVFADNPYPHAVNGSLWTLPYEIRWYLILLALGLLTALRRRWLISLIWVAIYVNYFFAYRIDQRVTLHGEHHYAAELGIFFMGGVLLHSFDENWRRHRFGWFACAAAGTLLLTYFGFFMAALALAVPVLAIAFGSASTRFLRRAGRFGDPSYGIYIYAFLVQQTVTALTQNRFGYFGALAISLSITVMLGYLSWHLVERPSLRIKHWFGPRLPRGSKLTSPNSSVVDTTR